MIKPFNNVKDRLDRPCENGCGGVYRDSNIIDNFEGLVHCIVCHDRVSRYTTDTSGPKEEK